MAAESLSDIKTDNRRYLIIRQASGNVSNLIPGEMRDEGTGVDFAFPRVLHCAADCENRGGYGKALGIIMHVVVCLGYYRCCI